MIDIRDIYDSINPITVTYVDSDGDWQVVEVTLSESDWRMWNYYFQSDSERSVWLQNNLSSYIDISD